jgi:hypothetical protein
MQASAAAQPEHPVVPVAADGVTVYVSKYRRYRVQITAPRTYTDPMGVRTSGGKMLVAMFDDGVYRNNERDPKTRKLIDELLQANPYFGKFGSNADFWLASEQQAQLEGAQVQSALNTLKALPRETVEQFVAELRQGDADDHTLPSSQ